MERGDKRHLSRARNGRAFEPFKRSENARRPHLEVGLFLEDVLEQDGDGALAAGARALAPDLHARTLEVSLQPVKVLEQLRQLRVSRLARERRLAFCDERARKGAIAVQRRRRAAAAPGARVQLEGNLRACVQLRSQIRARSLDEIAQGRL